MAFLLFKKQKGTEINLQISVEKQRGLLPFLRSKFIKTFKIVLQELSPSLASALLLNLSLVVEIFNVRGIHLALALKISIFWSGAWSC